MSRTFQVSATRHPGSSASPSGRGLKGPAAALRILTRTTPLPAIRALRQGLLASRRASCELLDAPPDYIEDCEVCCQPMRVLVSAEGDIQLLREDD
ncbi:CPXCG motif-containing cysteine-rich protein [Saccharospirillum sp. HFRX-2]|uniref:CPXCG motif-containing cysteine-rich protein n=1 Tax=unclassified Saccharospirillum TaxID=2633430 RepID=UPI00372004BA